MTSFQQVALDVVYPCYLQQSVLRGLRVEFRSGDETDLDLFEVFDLMVSKMFFVIFYLFFGGKWSHLE